MQDFRMTNEYYDENPRLSLSCIVVAAVFFIVLSQILFERVPDALTLTFRPLIIFLLVVKALQSGSLRFAARNIALATAAYFALVLVLNDWNSDEFMNGGAAVLYVLMFWAVVGTGWSKAEVRFILFACFAASVVCAAIMFYYNPYNDLSVARGGTMIFNGAPINRNKNAYPFGMAALIGIAYLLKGGRHKLVFGAATLFVAYALMYSQCRGAFFCTVAGVLILLLSEIRAIYKKNPAKATLFAVLMILAFAAGYIAIKNSDFSRLVDSDSTSGRETGIRNAWNMFLGSDLFGKIFGSGFMYEQLHSDTVGAHLVYLTLLVSTGLIGMTLVVLIFASTFRRVRGDIPLALCSFAFVRTFFEGMDYYIYIPLILGTIIFNCFELNGRSCNELFAVKKR